MEESSESVSPSQILDLYERRKLKRQLDAERLMELEEEALELLIERLKQLKGLQ